ncbi:phage tail tape measure protein [Jeotgalibacillus marinus]|uniref:Phage tail tape measure protein n=1 Tax=Jeotgalibacillus marinus TaxID=86667 RepID=A0ABV3Q7B3_9BACL
MANQSISIKVTADTKDVEKGMKQATSAVAKAANKITAISDVFKNIGKSIDTNVTNPLKELGGNVEQVAKIFDESMSRVETALSDKLVNSSNEAKDSMQSLRDEALLLGSTTVFSMTEAAAAMEKLAQAGWETHEVLAGIGSIVDLASQSAMDLATTIDLVTQTLDMFNLTAEQASQVTDMLAFAQNNAGINVLELCEALRCVSESSSIAGLSLAETTAILGLFITSGLEGTVAGTTFTAMLQGLTNSATEAALAIGDINIALVNAEGIMLNMMEILTLLEEATYGMTNAQRELALGLIFSTEAMVGVNTVLMQGTETLINFADMLNMTTEATVGVNTVLMESTETLSSFAGGLTLTTGAVIGANAVLMQGTEILREFAEGMENVKGTTDEASDTMDNGLVPSIFNSADEIKNMMDTVLGLDDHLKTLIDSKGNLKVLLPGLTAAVTALGVAFKFLTTNPIGIAITVIASLIAIGILLWQNWDTIKEKALAIWSSITDKISQAKDKVKEIIDKIVSTLKDKFNDAKDKVKEIVGNIVESITGKFGEAKDKVKEIVDNIIGFFTGMKLDIPKPKLPSLPKFEITGKFSLTPPSIPKVSVGWHKDGGVFNGASIIGVGEAGAEAVVPLSGHRMNPFAQAIANEMPGNGSSGGGGVYEFNLSIPLDGRELARRTVRYTSEELERLRIRTKGSF